MPHNKVQNGHMCIDVTTMKEGDLHTVLRYAIETIVIAQQNGNQIRQKTVP